MANTRTNGPHLSFRKDGEVGGYWTTTLPGGGEGGVAAPTIPVFQLSHLGSSATPRSIGPDA